MDLCICRAVDCPNVVEAPNEERRVVPFVDVERRKPAAAVSEVSEVVDAIEDAVEEEAIEDDETDIGSEEGVWGRVVAVDMFKYSCPPTLRRRPPPRLEGGLRPLVLAPRP